MMPVYDRKTHEFLYGVANNRDTGGAIKPQKYAPIEDLEQLEKKWEELRDFARNTKAYTGQQELRINNLEQELRIDSRGTSNRLSQIEQMILVLMHRNDAQRATKKRRRVTVRANGQEVEVTRND